MERRVFQKRDIEAFQAILVDVLQGEDLVANERDLPLDLLLLLGLKAGDLRLEPKTIGSFLRRRAGGRVAGPK
jgi:hypothetical protein